MLCTVRRAQFLSAILVFASSLMMSQNPSKSQCAVKAEVAAVRIATPIQLDAAHPALQWEKAQPISFCADWQGKNSDPQRQTTVRLLWDAQTLYLHFECRYRDLFVFDDSDRNGRRDHLWDRDVAEVFLQPDPSRLHEYKELEISPNGMWIDLDIFPTGRADLKSGLERSVFLHPASHTWTAEIAIPIKSLTKTFDPAKVWKVNFFRVEGKQEPRSYFSWQATHTPQPNFHVPEVFGVLHFVNR